MNYSEYLKNGGEDYLPKERNKKFLYKLVPVYQCQACGVFKPASDLLDIKKVPKRAEDWACSSCWSSWKRKLLPIVFAAGTDESLCETEWLMKFLNAAGGHNTEHLKGASKEGLIRKRDAAIADKKPSVLINKLQGRIDEYSNPST
jgi:hypothetical protein